MKKEMEDTIIIGAGMTGLAAGYRTGYPVYEAGEYPGGICSSYYIRPGETRRLDREPEDGEAYRFEIGGGHWIFGAEPDVLDFIESLTSVQTYLRKAAVLFSRKSKFVPYPIQNHLSYLGEDQARDIIREINSAGEEIPRTMNEWLLKNFGPILGKLFFGPFHEMYTAGLYKKIAPQDAYKSPVDIETVIRGAAGETGPVGYNAQFAYPVSGLDTLARKLAEKADVRYKKQAVRLDIENNVVHFADGTAASYRKLISTVPLNRAMEMAELEAPGSPEPFSSVLELNIGARKGPNCPEDHWLYIPDSSSGFFRIGFYSNVNPSFIPRSARTKEDRVGIYVERAYPGGEMPDEEELEVYKKAVEDELQGLGFIGEVEINDHTWIDVAYTWSWPENPWKEEALKVLAENDIIQAGRYARWGFQGIAVSIKEGLSLAGVL
ncbi:MAG: protoporphyrinogen oxidase-like protein [Candidatus Auribacterota bacterium]|nr:protoporphyrinogen oxidase-like protein [Candidatus Auribacterota bacterium]